MQTIKVRFSSLLMAALLCSMAAFAYAESAPVYDVDSMPTQQFDGGANVGQDLPPPPTPDQDGSMFCSCSLAGPE